MEILLNIVIAVITFSIGYLVADWHARRKIEHIVSGYLNVSEENGQQSFYLVLDEPIPDDQTYINFKIIRGKRK